mmetsp:Transcript_115240/g.366338  ORF Transcript_115240/g.366338 Transcript_115240/m.366338 type:complete len:281 (+) Transcript_115240:1387-2229(+)
MPPKYGGVGFAGLKTTESMPSNFKLEMPMSMPPNTKFALMLECNLTPSLSSISLVSSVAYTFSGPKLGDCVPKESSSKRALPLNRTGNALLIAGSTEFLITPSRCREMRGHKLATNSSSQTTSSEALRNHTSFSSQAFNWQCDSAVACRRNFAIWLDMACCLMYSASSSSTLWCGDTSSLRPAKAALGVAPVGKRLRPDGDILAADDEDEPPRENTEENIFLRCSTSKHCGTAAPLGERRCRAPSGASTLDSALGRCATSGVAVSAPAGEVGEWRGTSLK